MPQFTANADYEEKDSDPIWLEAGLGVGGGQ
jgi:hypothetical protein